LTVLFLNVDGSPSNNHPDFVVWIMQGILTVVSLQ
jgi:hypothetical protein